MKKTYNNTIMVILKRGAKIWKKIKLSNKKRSKKSLKKRDRKLRRGKEIGIDSNKGVRKWKIMEMVMLVVNK
jgi:hypothetical protein